MANRFTFNGCSAAFLCNVCVDQKEEEAVEEGQQGDLQLEATFFFKNVGQCSERAFFSSYSIFAYKTFFFFWFFNFQFFVVLGLGLGHATAALYLQVNLFLFLFCMFFFSFKFSCFS